MKLKYFVISLLIFNSMVSCWSSDTRAMDPDPEKHAKPKRKAQQDSFIAAVDYFALPVISETPLAAPGFCFPDYESAFVAIQRGKEGSYHSRMTALLARDSLHGAEAKEFLAVLKILRDPIYVSIPFSDGVLNYQMFDFGFQDPSRATVPVELDLHPEPKKTQAYREEVKRRQADSDDALKQLHAQGGSPGWSLSNFLRIRASLFDMFFSMIKRSCQPGYLPPQIISEVKSLFPINGPVLHLNMAKKYLTECDVTVFRLRRMQAEGVDIYYEAFTAASTFKQESVIGLASQVAEILSEGGERKDEKNRIEHVLPALSSLQALYRYIRALRPTSPDLLPEQTMYLPKEVHEAGLILLLEDLVNGFILLTSKLGSEERAEKQSIDSLVSQWLGELKHLAPSQAQILRKYYQAVKGNATKLGRVLSSPYGRSLVRLSSMEALILSEEQRLEIQLLEALRLLPGLLYSKSRADSREDRLNTREALRLFEETLCETYSSHASLEEKYRAFFISGSILRPFAPFICGDLCSFYVRTGELTAESLEKASLFARLGEEFAGTLGEFFGFHIVSNSILSMLGDQSSAERLYHFYLEIMDAKKDKAQKKVANRLKRLKDTLTESRREALLASATVSQRATHSSRAASQAKDASQGPLPMAPLVATWVKRDEPVKSYQQEQKEKIARHEKREALRAEQKEMEKMGACAANFADDANASEASQEGSLGAPIVRPTYENLPFVNVQLTHAQKALDSAICDGTFSFTREELLNYFTSFGCKVRNGKGSHLVAELPTFISLPDDGGFLGAISLEADIELGGSYPFGKWDGKRVPMYIRKQLPGIRQKLWNYFSLQQGATPAEK